MHSLSATRHEDLIYSIIFIAYKNLQMHVVVLKLVETCIRFQNLICAQFKYNFL